MNAQDGLGPVGDRHDVLHPVRSLRSPVEHGGSRHEREVPIVDRGREVGCGRHRNERRQDASIARGAVLCDRRLRGAEGHRDERRGDDGRDSAFRHLSSSREWGPWEGPEPYSPNLGRAE